MKIIFTVEVHTFEKAAKIEATLKSEDIKFQIKMDSNSTRRSPSKPMRRTAITKSELAVIAKKIGDSPNAPDSVIAKWCNVSAATVGRVRSGKHALQG